MVQQTRRSAAPLSREELHRFRAEYGSKTDEVLARRFNLTPEQVQKIAKLYKLGKDKAFVRRHGGRTTMPRWTSVEIEQLRTLYPMTSNLEIARLLNRSLKSVVSKANQLELHKSEERLIIMGRTNVRQRYAREPAT